MTPMEQVIAIWIALARGIEPVDSTDGSHNYWLFVTEARMIIQDALKYRKWMDGKENSPAS